MRTRKEVEAELEDFDGVDMSHMGVVRMRLAVEVLLDIRDLLAKPDIQNDFGKAKESLSEKP